MGRGPRTKRRKPAVQEPQPLDAFAADDQLPAEEQPKNVNKRYDLADGLEFELPSDVEEDEEIDEDMAFTAEDKIRYAGMFGDDADDAEPAEEDLLTSDVSEDENFADDHSEDEAAAAGSDSDDEQRHAAMLADVRAAGDGNRKRKRRDVLMSEAYPESEYNLNPASGGGEAGELQLSDLIRGLGASRSKLGASRKLLERLERRGQAVAAPLPGNVQARQERKAAYEVTSNDVTKWQPMVKANREAPTLAFSKPRGGAAKATTTAALTAQHLPETDMEAEVAAMLQAAGMHSAKAVEEAEDALALKALSAEEQAARRDRLAKMRALLFYHERKAARMKAIKSKDYRRRLNRAERRKAEKAGDGSGAALREAAEEAEFERAKERLTLKHKNTSKWAKRALRRGINVMDETTKEAMQEQLRLGMTLRQKVQQAQSSESDSEGSTSASDEEGDQEPGSGRDGDGAAAAADAGGAGAARAAKHRAAYGKSRAAALEVLQEANGDAEEGRGLFGLPFMRRAAEQQRAAAAADAASLLHSIEAEVAGVPEDELQRDDQQGAAQGRFAFGTGADFGQPGAAAAAADHSDDDNSGAGEHEDAQARVQRLTRAQEREAAAEAASGAGGRAGGVTRGATRSGGAAPGAAAVALPASRPDGGAQPSGNLAADVPGMQPAAQLNRRLRDDRLFGGASASLGGAGGANVQQAGSSRGVSIGPAGRVVSGSAAVEPVSAAAAGSPAVLAAGASAAGAAGSAQTANGSGGSGDDSSGDEAGEAAPADAMQPMSGAELTQRELVAMAFAGDDVAADFAAQKAEEADAEAPVADAAPGALPGWGSWASAKRMQRDAEAAARKAQQQKEAALAKRRDARQAHVIISEKWDRKAQKYAAAAVPFPFDGRDTYERSIRQPLGADFNTNASFRDLTRPAVIKEAGLLIQPLKYSRGASDKTAGNTGTRGPRPAKGEGPPKNRPRVRVLAGGMPRN